MRWHLSGLSKVRLISLLSLLITVTLISKVFISNFVGAQENIQIVYDDVLSDTWENWSWGVEANLNSQENVRTGNSSIRLISSSWGGLYLHSKSKLDISHNPILRFSVKAVTDDPRFKIIFFDENNIAVETNSLLENYGGSPSKNSWKTYNIDLLNISGGKKVMGGFAIQHISDSSQQVVDIDDIQIVTASTPTPSAPDPEKDKTDTGIIVYNDYLQPDWENWSWGTHSNFNFSNEVFAGTRSIELKFNEKWGGFYLHSIKPIQTEGSWLLRMSLKANSAGQEYQIALYDDNNSIIQDFLSLNAYAGNPEKGVWKTYNIGLDRLNPHNKRISGIVLQNSGDANSLLFADEISFIVNSGNHLPQNTSTPQASPVPVQEVSAQPRGDSSGYTVANNKIYKNRNTIQLKGINWFGFETETLVAHGLWQRNYKDVIQQIKTLGFNSVRLPFCPQTLRFATPTSIDYSINNDLSGLNSTQVLDKFMNEFNNQQIYVLLDHHRPDCQAISELWYTSGYSETQWIDDLVFLAERYKNLEYLLGIDLKNEPHGRATWGTGNLATDWNTAAEKAGKAILSKNPNLLIFVEGIQENPVCSSNISHWMGGNLEPINCSPISASSIPADKLVLSPHVYGPDVYQQSYFSDAAFPNNMTGIWNIHFGDLLSKGYTLVPGEWGGKYGNGGDPKDVAWHNTLVDYFVSKGICNSYYWNLNPNSGDTGGVLLDDWTTPTKNKVDLLNRYFSGCRN